MDNKIEIHKTNEYRVTAGDIWVETEPGYEEKTNMDDFSFQANTLSDILETVKEHVNTGDKSGDVFGVNYAEIQQLYTDKDGNKYYKKVGSFHVARGNFKEGFQMELTF